MAPVDYLMVRFPGNKLSGKIVPELVDLEKKGIIRVIDLVFVLKDQDGKIMITEEKDLQGDARKAYDVLAKNANQYFYEGDVELLASGLPNNSSAALLLFEDVWALQLKQALLDADAELVDMGRIPPENLERVREIIAKGGASA